MTDTIRVLHIEDDPLDAEIVELELRKKWHTCDYVLISSETELIERLAAEKFDIILADYSLPEYDGLSALAYVSRHSPETPFIFISGTMGEELAINTLKSGATDYVLKTRLERLIPSVERALLEASERTKRRSAEARLIKSEAELKALTDNLPDVIARFDRDHRHLFVNQAITRLTGIPVSGFLGKTDQELGMPEKLVKLWNEKLDAAFTTGDEQKLDFSFEEENGQHYFESRLVPECDSNGNITSILCIAHDITERKLAEEEKRLLERQFQQTQKLESLGVLAGGIAHDFNNILTVIICNCSLLKNRPQMADELVPEIEIAAQRAADLCRQMLVYAGKAQPVPTKVNMTSLVDEMTKMLKATINQNVSIKHIPSTDIPSIKADASQLRQVVMNLIINAAESIGEAQGEIRVSLVQTEITDKLPVKDHLGNKIAPGKYICLEVADNGCGMDEETQRRIFEPFYTTKFTGRGLGMSAVLGIISAHHAALQLFSQRGQGTTFTVYLPIQLTEPTNDDSIKQISSKPWQGSGTILLVEDEPQILLIAKMLMKALGFTVIEAANGKEALELYNQNAEYITLVVADIGMPVMDGYELLHKLKERAPELPIIISSGFGETPVSSRIAVGEVAGFLSKPYNFEQLREVLKKVLVGAEGGHE